VPDGRARNVSMRPLADHRAWLILKQSSPWCAAQPRADPGKGGALTGGAPSRRSSSGEERKEEPLCGSGEAHPRAGDRHQGRVQGSQRRGLEGYFVDASRPPMNLGIWGFRRGRRRGRIWGCRRGRRRGGFGASAGEGGGGGFGAAAGEGGGGGFGLPPKQAGSCSSGVAPCAVQWSVVRIGWWAWVGWVVRE
jgi:hypothetical protein